MESAIIPWVSMFLTGLFVFVAAWQRRIDRSKTRQVIAEIQEAHSRGTHRAIAQHPQIEPLRCIGCASCITACPENGVIALVNGIAQVVHGSRCIGHGRCADLCPVQALTVGLGDISGRPDIPVVSEQYETSVPGLYIAGELGGIALVRNAIEQGAMAMEDIARSVKSLGASSDPDVLDVLIVGAGPSGLAASLKAVERGVSYLTIDQSDLGGTVSKYPRRKLVLTQPVELPLYGRMKAHEYRKEELIEMWEGVARKYRLNLETRVKLDGVKKEGDVFVAETSTGLVRSRFVVLALGRRGTPRKLGVPGEEAEKVLYQLMDAATYTSRHILVVGGGDSAIEAATGLANQPGNVVTLSYRKANFFRLKPRNEDRIREYVDSGRLRLVFSSRVLKVEPDSVELAIQEESSATKTGDAGKNERTETLPNDFVFVFAGGIPPFPLLKSSGIAFGGSDAKKAKDGAEEEKEKPAIRIVKRQPTRKRERKVVAVA